MTVLAIGSDLVSVDRIREVYRRHGERLVRRLLTAPEYQRYARLKDPAGYLARRFAAKEAAAKALGTGIANGVTFRDIEVLNGAAGEPELYLHGAAAARARALGVQRWHLTLSDERDFALAFVLLESV